jgi:catechol 2,3-dioxygenase-like lactoylglutathione lyase family enzyme
MFGRFLELGLATRDIMASAAFYQRLGFSGLAAGDTYVHRYGAFSDGRLHLGLHERAGGSATLCFVLPELAAKLGRLRAAGFEPTAARLGSEDFHEIELRDPEGTGARLLEARTYSPHAGARESSLGHFAHWSLPVRDAAAASVWWERAGFVALPESEEPYAHLPLTSDHLDLAFHSPRLLGTPCLVFVASDMPARIAGLRAAGERFASDLPRGLDPAGSALLEAPEGTLLLLLQARD